MSFRQAVAVCCLLLIADAVCAAPCTKIKAHPKVWITNQVDALITTARGAFDDEKGIPAYNRVLDGIAKKIDQCKLNEDNAFATSYPKFIEYIAALSLMRRPNHELGFTVPDKQYFAETRQYVEIPDFLLDQEFLRNVSRNETLDRAKAFLRRLNIERKPAEQLVFLSYKSQHLGTPDNDDSFIRLLILVPGNPAAGVPEKWVQFGVTDPGARRRVRNVSVVATTPGPDRTSNVYFKDFFRTYRRDGSITLKGRWELGFGDDNCVQCHKSGVLPIFPETDSVKADEQPALIAVNQRFLTYGPPRFDRYRDETKFGPGLSSANAQDRKHRFGSDFKGRVADAMVCNSCHTNDRLGMLNWPMDQVLLSSFITGGRMPFGSSLRVSERNELYDKLIEEYFSTSARNPGILKSWLLGKQP
jgi:hypothetical protein